MDVTFCRTERCKLLHHISITHGIASDFIIPQGCPQQKLTSRTDVWLWQLQFLARGQHVLPGVKDFIRSVSVEYLPSQMGPLSESIDAILQARGFSYKSFGSRQSKGHHVPGSPPTEHELQSDWARVPPEEIATPEQTGFLPMFPWYSGTSADMYRTVFDLIISLKLFLGRFDMRTMQVRIERQASHLLLTPQHMAHQMPIGCRAHRSCLVQPSATGGKSTQRWHIWSTAAV